MNLLLPNNPGTPRDPDFHCYDWQEGAPECLVHVPSSPYTVQSLLLEALFYGISSRVLDP